MKEIKKKIFTFVYFLYLYICCIARLSIKIHEDCLHNDRKSGDPGCPGLQLWRWSRTGETFSRDFHHSQGEEEEEETGRIFVHVV